ncbi:hypothetical protein PybrP1_000378 [[Pythium] brassicae (nom. inval.)]|nr:hypothetical protein PybrP1_000378 [[Pythium] brassicae (nom. inval.)]
MPNIRQNCHSETDEGSRNHRDAKQAEELNGGKGPDPPPAAAKLTGLDAFDRPSFDVKKAPNRFLALLKKHKLFNNNSACKSGAADEYTEKHDLQDELANADGGKKPERKSISAESEKRVVKNACS